MLCSKVHGIGMNYTRADVMDMSMAEILATAEYVERLFKLAAPRQAPSSD